MLGKSFKKFPRLNIWYRFTKCCLNRSPFPFDDAQQISNLAIEVPRFIQDSTREDLSMDDFENFVAHILGIYFTTIGHHDSIKFLSIARHELEALIILRPQMEALLILLYFIEPNHDLDEVYARVDQYRDWLLVKMKRNMDRSYKFDLLDSISKSDNFQKAVLANYDTILKKYSSSRNDLKLISNAHSFLKNKRKVAIAYKIEDLYDHIYAESSASIHVADISDRMQDSEKPNFNGYTYRIQNDGTGFWAMLMSNMLLIHAIKHFSKFLGIEKIIGPKIENILR